MFGILCSRGSVKYVAILGIDRLIGINVLAGVIIIVFRIGDVRFRRFGLLNLVEDPVEDRRHETSCQGTSPVYLDKKWMIVE